MVSVDGFFAGNDGNINWHNVDKEFNEFAIKQLDEVGILLFGKTTYDVMESYWPKEKTIKNDPVVAGLMNSLPKIVFSRLMDKADWNNTELKHEIKKSDIEKLKQKAEKDLFIFGSGTIVQEFAKLGLVDEYRLMVNPVVLGAGKPLFKEAMKLKLLKSKQFNNGNVLLNYQ